MLPGAWVAQAQKFRRQFQREALALFRDVDILLAPATPCRAPKLGQKTFVLDGREMLVRPNIGLFTQPLSFIGLPVVAAPVWTDGEKLPIGVQIIAAPWREDLALRVACGARAGRRRSRAGRNIVLTRRKWPSAAILDGPAAMARRPRYATGYGARLVEAQVNVGPVFDRIPNFVGADVAAKRLSELDEWRRARVVKCNPDPPQIPVRLRALYDGKLLFSPVPYLTKGFPYLRIDPDKLAAKGVDFETAATAQGFMQHGEPIGFEDMPKLDFCVVGCVAVTRSGGRTGKGAGFADLEQGLFRELGLVGAGTPIATTVHSSQVVDDSAVVMESHDSALHFIATELELIATRTQHPQPSGVDWDKVRPDQFADIPFLSALRDTIERRRRTQ